ncbi:hypothetical protein N481_16680 [Pseudoalteromonas luteoviolacea S4047-1]|uniref:Uncharacterized protein n=1 Tax=Pseudoalteromonas luteoviolacea S4054 TaxID=1129367 RepID=A0A0F6AAT8_9GAMM|nr:hypothetical protein N479_18045 [Pseudoalteromonas luteoviolacea S4054]KZN72046.1 hypothetical protein N481_16680 [Pseudoalteromonas luteoviolacea S4047-1]
MLLDKLIELNQVALELGLLMLIPENGKKSPF